MSYFNKNSWVFPLLGALITIIAVFTPATLYTVGGREAYIWMNQLAIEVISGSLVPTLWRWGLTLFILSNMLSAIIFVSPIIILTSTILYKRLSLDFHKVKKQWLIFAILIFLSTIGWIIMMEVDYVLLGSSHWQIYSPLFAVIGPFIGSALIIAGVFLNKE